MYRWPDDTFLIFHPDSTEGGRNKDGSGRQSVVDGTVSTHQSTTLTWNGGVASEDLRTFLWLLSSSHHHHLSMSPKSNRPEMQLPILALITSVAGHAGDCCRSMGKKGGKRKRDSDLPRQYENITHSRGILIVFLYALE